jgi:hypothetical protein
MFGSYTTVDEVYLYLRGNDLKFIDVFSDKASVGVIIYTLSGPDPWTGQDTMFTDSVRYDRVSRKLLGD